MLNITEWIYKYKISITIDNSHAFELSPLKKYLKTLQTLSSNFYNCLQRIA